LFLKSEFTLTSSIIITQLAQQQVSIPSIRSAMEKDVKSWTTVIIGISDLDQDCICAVYMSIHRPIALWRQRCRSSRPYARIWFKERCIRVPKQDINLPPVFERSSYKRNRRINWRRINCFHPWRIRRNIGGTMSSTPFVFEYPNDIFVITDPKERRIVVVTCNTKIVE